MKKHAAIILLTLIISQTAQAQTFKETMIEFKKFEAKTKAGINLPRYTESLANIEYAVDAYTTEADDLNKENKEKFQRALEKYKSAASAWRIYNSGRMHGVPESFMEISSRFCPKTRYFAIGETDNFYDCINEMWNDSTNILSGMKEIKQEEKKEEKKETKQSPKQISKNRQAP